MSKHVLYSYVEVLQLVLDDASKRTGVPKELLNGSVGENGAWVRHNNDFDLEKLPHKLTPGTKVLTTTAKVHDWTAEALLKRKWGVRGEIITHHDSHGLCYDVQHSDGSVGTYDPSEFEIRA